MEVAHIPFDSEFDESNLHYIKHSKTVNIDGVLEVTHDKCQLLSENAGPYEILKFLQRFDRIRHALGWDDGPKLFNKFPEHLQGFHRDIWDDQVEGANTTTLESFNTELALFKNELLDGYNYGDQMAYLRVLRKPGKMTPNTYLLKLRAANRLVKSLPGAPDVNPGFDDEELKRRFLEAMPSSWAKNFHNADMTLEKCTLMDVKRYMDRQHLMDPFVDKKDNDANRSNNEQNRSRNNQHGSNNRRGNRGGNNSRNNNRNGRNTNSDARPGRIQPSDPCPLPGHGNHTWGECHSNAHNQAKSSNRNYQSRNNYQNQNQSRQNHHINGTPAPASVNHHQVNNQIAPGPPNPQAGSNYMQQYNGPAVHQDPGPNPHYFWPHIS